MCVVYVSVYTIGQHTQTHHHHWLCVAHAWLHVQHMCTLGDVRISFCWWALPSRKQDRTCCATETTTGTSSVQKHMLSLYCVLLSQMKFNDEILLVCVGVLFSVKQNKKKKKSQQSLYGFHFIFFSFTNRQRKKDQWVAPSVLVPCHQLTSQWPTVNSPSAPDGEPAMQLCIIAN